MDQTATPMFDPTGKVRQIPSAQVDDAKRSGGRIAVRMLDLKGTQRWIPEDQVDQALQAGGKKVGGTPPAAPQTPQQIIQERTGIHPYKNPAAQVAAGPVRAAWGLIRSPYDLAKAAFSAPKNPEEMASEATNGHLGLLLDRMLEEPAEAAHQTAKELREDAIATRQTAKRITSYADNPEELAKLRKQYPQMDLSTPEKAREAASTLTKQAIKLYVESVPADMGAIPIIGPMGQQAGARMAAGDVPGAMTESAANAFMMGAPKTVGKITEPVTEPIKGWVSDLPDRGGVLGVTKDAAHSVTEHMTGVHPRTAANLVDETIEQNAEATRIAAEKTAKARADYEAAKNLAEHETTGKEHAYNVAVNAKKELLVAEREQEIAEAKEHNARTHAKAQEAHAQKTADVESGNQRILDKHEKVAARRREENAAAEHALEMRKQKETELKQETDAYYAKEDEVKAKAKAEENAAWQPWREKMRGVTIDGGQIAKPLEKIAAVSPDVARTLRQLIPDPGDAAPDSMYAQDRRFVMKSLGYGEDTNYWELPPERRTNIDAVAKSNGYEPEPIDFDPQAGVALPIEQVHRAQSIIGQYLRSGRFEGPILHEMNQVYKVLKGAETRASEAHGALGDLETARATTRKYQGAFGRERHVPRTGDEIREKTANPEAYKEREDQERLDAAAQHSPELVNAHKKVQTLRDELRKMPTEDQLRKQGKQIPLAPSVGDLRSSYRLKAKPTYRPPTEGDLRQGHALKPVPHPHAPGELEAETFQQVEQPLKTPPPEPPKETKAEIKQAGEREIAEANQKELDRRINYLRAHGIWLLGSAVATTAIAVMTALIQAKFGVAVEEAIGGAIVSPLTVVGLNKVAGLLEKPGVREWLTRPTVAQIRELDKLPPEQRAAVAEGVRKMKVVADKKGYRVSPMLLGFAAENRKKEQE